MKRNAANSNLDTALLGCGFRNRRCTIKELIRLNSAGVINSRGHQFECHIDIISYPSFEGNPRFVSLNNNTHKIKDLIMAYHFTPGQIFAPILPITRRRTLAYIVARRDNTLVVAECGKIHTVNVQINQAFGNEFAQVVGRDDDFVISAPCALSGLELREAQSQIAEQSRVLARGE